MHHPYKAFIFDLNGTMIDDMDFHIRAWQWVLKEATGNDLGYTRLKNEMYGKNEELLDRLFGAGRFREAEVRQLVGEKEKRYRESFLPHLGLVAGLDAFLNQAHTAGIPMAIGSAAIRANIDFVVDNLGIRHLFQAIVAAEDVAQSKPHPETFLQAAALLALPPQQCIVFEDAPKGVEAAARAGIQAFVLTTLHGQEEFVGYTNIIGCAPHYTHLSVAAVLSGKTVEAPVMPSSGSQHT